MAIFNDLAIELQEAIWELVLPTSRGVHWIEVEGIPHDPEFIRDSIRMTQWHKFDRMPETDHDVLYRRRNNSDWSRRARTIQEESSPFFRRLLTTVPAAFGRPGPDDSEELQRDLSDQIAYTQRCRKLSTYYQITTLLQICRLSRHIAKRYIRDNSKFSWPIRRSMGTLFRPRPMDVWEAQYDGDQIPTIPSRRDCRQVLPSGIHTLDLVVFRLHDSQGRATPLLKHGPWQYFIERATHGSTFACFDRIGLEWHPLWDTVGGRGELRPGNVKAMIRTMVVNHNPATLYWLVDGVPRPDWKRDYPAVVKDIFAKRMAEEKQGILEHFNWHWESSPEDHVALLADQHLGQEFEANGRRYFIVFVVCSQFNEEERYKLDKAGLGYSGPFPGSAAMWPEALREPARLALDVFEDGNLGTKHISYILSWEPIGQVDKPDF